MSDSNDKKNSSGIRGEIEESAHKIWLAGLGAVSTIEKEGNKLFRSLVEKGEDFESSGKETAQEVRTRVEDAAGKARDRAGESWSKVEERLDGIVTSALQRVGVPSGDEIATLTQRVEELTKMVESLKSTKGSEKA